MVQLLSQNRAKISSSRRLPNKTVRVGALQQKNEMVKQAGSMEQVFPDALKTLREADEEMYALIQEEKERQW